MVTKIIGKQRIFKELKAIVVPSKGKTQVLVVVLPYDAQMKRLLIEVKKVNRR